MGRGQTTGILPGLDHGDANPYIDTAGVTGLGQMCNLLVVMNGDPVIAMKGGYGTLSEVALALKTCRPVIPWAPGKAFLGLSRRQAPEKPSNWRPGP